MDLFPRVPAWMPPVQPSFSLHRCGRYGLRHGWNTWRARVSTCFNCDRRGHYARMCRTRNSGPVNAVIVTASPTMRTIGIQTEEKLKQKSTKKQSRDRERIRTFTKFRKERQNSVLNELPFSTVNVTEIKCEKLENEIKRFRETIANLKTESQLLKDKWAKERKCYTTRIKKLCEELKRRAEELEHSNQEVRICQHRKCPFQSNHENHRDTDRGKSKTEIDEEAKKRRRTNQGIH